LHNYSTIVLDRMLLDHLPAGVVVHDQDSAILAVNRAAQRLLGHGVDEVIGKFADDPIWRFIHPDGTPMASTEFPATKTLREREPIADLVLGVERDHGPGRTTSIRWLICNAYPVFDAHGHLHSAVVCFTDCTELKSAEQALQRSEQRLQLVLRGSDEASWDWNLLTQQLYYSPRWWDMLGYTADALPTTPQLWSSLLPEGDRERVEGKAIERVVRGIGGAVALAVTPVIEDDHAVGLGEVVQLVREVFFRAAEAMHEQQHRAGAPLHDLEANPVVNDHSHGVLLRVQRSLGG